MIDESTFFSSGSGLEDINVNARVDFVDGMKRGLEIPNSEDFNTAAPHKRKSINISFRTGNNVTVKQQIFEQCGGTRGLNFYIRNSSLTLSTHNYKDTEPHHGLNHYRLKQTDLNGDFEYSEVRSVDIVYSDLLTFKISPNPVSSGEKTLIQYQSREQQVARKSIFNT